MPFTRPVAVKAFCVNKSASQLLRVVPSRNVLGLDPGHITGHGGPWTTLWMRHQTR